MSLIFLTGVGLCMAMFVSAERKLGGLRDEREERLSIWGGWRGDRMDKRHRMLLNM